MTMWIAAISRGHNGSVCLMKDNEIVFHIEEERLTRGKYDGAPLLALLKVKEYTDKLDYLVLAHTQLVTEAGVGRMEYTGENVYHSLARKLGLIARHEEPHPQIIDYGLIHHKLHAACAFYKSGFESATAVIVDGAGSFLDFNYENSPMRYYEVESIYGCDYPKNGGIKGLYKHCGSNGASVKMVNPKNVPEWDQDDPDGSYLLLDGTTGIVKSYEAVTQYCGWDAIEAGKTMGLSPYGKPNDNIPPIFSEYATGDYHPVNKDLFIPFYPNSSIVDESLCDELRTPEDIESSDYSRLQNRRDMAYAVQKETQDAVLHLIRTAAKSTGNPNVVVSGGYGLNCVANYYYREQLKDEGINLYVEPISSDAGTSVGAALYHYYKVTNDNTIVDRSTLYLGPKYDYTLEEIQETADKYGAIVQGAIHKDVIDLITDKNIVALFQGRSEAGPRALGNRSILYDPTDLNGKDIVNKIKRREYFRPFAGSILKDHVHEWFDLRGLEETPHMMYAVECQEGIEEKIPAIIHVDGTCRIQTVTPEENKIYHEIITEFFERTGCPIVFNTSFNLGGEPLVETLDDALRTLANSDIEYLYLPEYGKMITYKND
tara:strand:- start:1450 stop:3252 length:1803 start_codon:yes stop_codon:yes gene_type:complete